MTPREFSTYQKLQGRLLKQSLTRYLDSDPDANAHERADAFESIMLDVRKEINNTVFPALMIKRYKLPLDTNVGGLINFLREMSKDSRLKTASKERQEKWLKTQLSR